MIKKYNTYGPLLYLLFVFSVYINYIVHGTFVYDDWSVSLLGNVDTLTGAYSAYFGSFTNRPLAPLYYALVSRFGSNPFGYIFINCALWCGSVLVISNVLRDIFDDFTASIFAYLASIPLLASTLIFSPGMQSLGSFAIFLWAFSFKFLHMACANQSLRLLGLSLFFILAMSISYEVCFPLLAISISLPVVFSKSILHWKKGDTIFFYNFLGIGVIVVLVLIYQKLIAPALFGNVGNISRFRVSSLSGLPFILHLTYLLVTDDFPKLILKGVSVARHAKISLEIIPPFLLGSYGILAAFRRSIGRRLSLGKSYFVMLFGSMVGIVGVGVIHWGATVGPSLYGYSNRGLGSLAILLPLLICIVLGYLFNKNKALNIIVLLVSIGIFSIYLSNFLLVRSNFIQISKIQKNIMLDLKASFESYGEVPYPRVILADVPEFLIDDFNGENIYSDEVHDWAMSLEVNYPGNYINSATLTKKKVCAKPKRVFINGDNLVLKGPDMVIPIKNIWFYRYDIISSQSSLARVSNTQEMSNLLITQFNCSEK